MNASVPVNHHSKNFTADHIQYIPIQHISEIKHQSLIPIDTKRFTSPIGGR